MGDANTLQKGLSALVPKLCLGTPVREAPLPVPRGGWAAAASRTRSGASRTCVPKQSLGTREKWVCLRSAADERAVRLVGFDLLPGGTSRILDGVPAHPPSRPRPADRLALRAGNVERSDPNVPTPTVGPDWFMSNASLKTRQLAMRWLPLPAAVALWVGIGPGLRAADS